MSESTGFINEAIETGRRVTLSERKFQHRQIIDSCYLALNLLRDVPVLREDVKNAALDLLKSNLTPVPLHMENDDEE